MGKPTNTRTQDKQYQINNGIEYNESLVRRSDVTLRLEENVKCTTGGQAY